MQLLADLQQPLMAAELLALAERRQSAAADQVADPQSLHVFRKPVAGVFAITDDCPVIHIDVPALELPQRAGGKALLHPVRK